MATSKYTSQSSEINNVVDRTITAAEKTPIERFDELIASCSNSNEHDPPQCQRSLVALLRRDLNHMTIAEERTSLLHRFGVALSQQNCKDIEIESLASIVQLDHTNHSQLVQLAQLSELCPLVSIETLTEDLSSLFRDFLCDPLHNLEGSDRNNRLSFRTFVDIICSEFLACSIIGCGVAVHETVLTYFPSFTQILSRESCRIYIDTTFPLNTLLTTRSFTDPDSSFFRLASKNPAFFHSIVEKHAVHISEIAISTAVSSVRVVSDSPSEPRCLDFGRATQNWVVLLKAMAEVKLDLTLPTKRLTSHPSSLLTFIVLSAASTNDELSTAAVSVFSNQFGLSKQRTEALLFATPTTFPVRTPFTPRHSQMLGDSDHMKGSRQSICAEAGRCVMTKSRSNFSAQEQDFDFTTMLGVYFAGSDVSATIFLPLAPFLTRILTIVVPSSTDRMDICWKDDEHSQLMNIFLSLILTLIHTSPPSALSTLPLSSLISILSVALVRLDSIPSSLALSERFGNLFSLSKNRSNPQVRQVVLALCEEGMEDRSDQVLAPFSLAYLNLWKGANGPHSVVRDQRVADHGLRLRQQSMDNLLEQIIIDRLLGSIRLNMKLYLISGPVSILLSFIAVFL
ncbi:hypothetical protein BLNAU_12406 [Blattamonas nauphoetae]|uniref:Uncharacterized protein n=1 Tax=Blattamonas nauphoetae TaxID=2049346 RepID=A0ABQ9XMM8_9EUKA|nr:hypothetical protein BLNAU_12406 [Blattamonas nauphoetae]